MAIPKGLVTKIAWSPDGTMLAVPTQNGQVELWDVDEGSLRRKIDARGGTWILSVAWSPDGNYLAVSSGDDKTRIWRTKDGQRQLRPSGATLTLDGTSAVWCPTIPALAIVRGTGFTVWNAQGWIAGSGIVGSQPTCLAYSLSGVLAVGRKEGDINLYRGLGRDFDPLGPRIRLPGVRVVAWSPDAKLIAAGSSHGTVCLFDADSGRQLAELEGHTRMIRSLSFSFDGRILASKSDDDTVRVWSTINYANLAVVDEPSFTRAAYGYTNKKPPGIAFHPNRPILATLGRWDRTVRIWELDVPSLLGGSHADTGIRYTTAKIVLVGESGSGKTGLTERLVHNRPPQRGPSTSGAWSTQWPLKDLPPQPGWEREVWLWDFGGQADQRLIHQLYLDRTALVLLMFNADQESVLTGLREWRQALVRSMARDPQTFLVAGRTDVGFRFDREKVRAFARENRYEYFETSAETGRGIPELRKAMLEKIPWNELTVHNSPVLFKRLKDEILKLRDEGQVLVTFKELESLLRLRLPLEVKFSDAHLETVVSLLDGPGVVKELGFGTYILLRPEWINVYAQAVIRTLRAAESGLGCLPVSSIVEGKLIFQTKQQDGKDVAEKRLDPADEKVVLQAMEQMLLERRLCLRQGGDLVFPSHCGLERPIGPVPPKFFVSYTIRGFLDDIYATLVVKLAHCGAFKLKELWRDAADFETLADRKIVGVKLVRGEDGRGELLAHHAPGVTAQEQVIFASYIHEHLSQKSTEEVPRLRFYSCPNCDEPVENRKLAMERLEKDGEKADIRCQRCDRFIPLWDTLEKRFASQAIRKKIELLRLQESSDLDTRRQGKLLVHEVSARITSANQMCHEIPGDVDEGIDLVVEFTDDDGRATGKHIYLQLKAGNSFLKKRTRDGAEIFPIKKQRWVKYWANQDGPMMLVVGTFPEEPERGAGGEKKDFAEVRWMEIGELLRNESDNGKKPVKQIVFKGERLDAQSVRGWRDRALSGQHSG